jgi:hypothetical protein
MARQVFAAIPLCVFVALCEILFASIRVPYSCPFAVIFCVLCALSRLLDFLLHYLRKSAALWRRIERNVGLRSAALIYCADVRCVLRIRRKTINRDLWLFC